MGSRNGSVKKTLNSKKKTNGRTNINGSKKQMGNPLVEPAQLGDLERIRAELDRDTERLKTQTEDVIETEKRVALHLRLLPRKEREERLMKEYDKFSENYDAYMTETGHYGAIRKAITNIVSGDREHFRFPILDLTAGTGVPLKYLLAEIFKKGRKKRAQLIGKKRTGVPLVWINDISNRMVLKAKELFKGYKRKGLTRANMKLTNHSYYDFPELYPHLEGKFGTVLVAQTFHVVSEKNALADVIDWALAPTGAVLLVEEFPWRISYDEFLLRMIRAAATPLGHKSDMVALFNGYKNIQKDGIRYNLVVSLSRHIGSKPSEPQLHQIDSPTHKMSALLLQKPEIPEYLKMQSPGFSND